MEESSHGKSLDEVDLTDDEKSFNKVDLIDNEKSLDKVLKQSKTINFLFFYVCFSLKICFSNGKGKGG